MFTHWSITSPDLNPFHILFEWIIFISNLQKNFHSLTIFFGFQSNWNSRQKTLYLRTFSLLKPIYSHQINSITILYWNDRFDASLKDKTPKENFLDLTKTCLWVLWSQHNITLHFKYCSIFCYVLSKWIST